MRIFRIAFILFLPLISTAQINIKINALADIGFSMAGSQSHYYYNGIDKAHTTPRVKLSQFNLFSTVNLNDNWSINTRLLIEQDKNVGFDKVSVPQFNVEWLSSKRKISITAGNFNNPFGSNNEDQLSTERDFIGLPLAYSYYVNVSDRIGYLEGLGDINNPMIDGVGQWGSTILYYGGYSTGTLMSWNIVPTKVNWKLALTTASSNAQQRISDPLSFTVVSRLKIQPSYFWEQGFSISHGSYMQRSEVSNQINEIGQFKQTIIGTDYTLGRGFFELSGELIWTKYSTPNFISDTREFVPNQVQDINSTSSYLDIKYEAPAIPGSFIAYRFDALFFNKTNTIPQQWDNDVIRHSIALGYDINQHILVRTMFSTQQVENKQWDKTQRTFQLMLTMHY